MTPQDANFVKNGSPEQDVTASARRDAIYAQISASLVDHYDTLYYVDIDTGTYTEISSTDDYKKLNVPATGKDFFAESRRSIRRYVHPDDQEKATRLHYKDTMLQNLQNRSSYSVSYRLVVDGTVRYIRNIEILTRDRKHILICIENIDDEVRAQLARQELQHQNVTFTQIAETLIMPSFPQAAKAVSSRFWKRARISSSMPSATPTVSFIPKTATGSSSSWIRTAFSRCWRTGGS